MAPLKPLDESTTAAFEGAFRRYKHANRVQSKTKLIQKAKPRSRKTTLVEEEDRMMKRNSENVSFKKSRSGSRPSTSPPKKPRRAAIKKAPDSCHCAIACIRKKGAKENLPAQASSKSKKTANTISEIGKRVAPSDTDVTEEPASAEPSKGRKRSHGQAQSYEEDVPKKRRRRKAASPADEHSGSAYDTEPSETLKTKKKPAANAVKPRKAVPRKKKMWRVFHLSHTLASCIRY
ncbi:hypothetical protein M422DRAFT_783272 [Sphaerobolus stellatus SS14]|uniref:Uncharacterized protein n=1 Tax=Sphaerobolus stellatus (strain SS14) TaxID=990650 RepID=A0A0C9UUU7_SPHS4|nr:hypothetical protein M422DRAFT_783272 [Sphaerobolus stellatus SS14]